MLVQLAYLNGNKFTGALGCWCHSWLVFLPFQSSIYILVLFLLMQMGVSYL